MIKDFQAQVVNAGVGVLRGYLANAEKVRVRGAEFDATARVTGNLTIYGAAAYTDGIYVSFPDAPPPLEDTGGPQVKDISGSVLPGISKWAFAFGGEGAVPAHLVGQSGQFFAGVDASYRSSFSSSASASRYLVVPATRCSMPASASGGRKGGRSSFGHATCLTRTIWSC